MMVWVDSIRDLFIRGGVVMYPLLALSIVSLAISLERALFWARAHGPAHARRWTSLTDRVWRGDLTGALALAETDATPYGRFASRAIATVTQGQVFTEGRAREMIEDARPALERFGTTLSTIITAAPMLGILGTVTGIIESFGFLSGAEAQTNPGAVADGIAEALYTTAFGIVIALVTLFPYAAFRAQADRAFSRLETLAGALIDAREGRSATAPRPGP